MEIFPVLSMLPLWKIDEGSDIIFKRELLPEPFAPKRPTFSNGLTIADAESNSILSEKDIFRLLILIIVLCYANLVCISFRVDIEYFTECKCFMQIQ